MNLLLPVAYNVSLLTDGGRGKQGILCKVILTVWFAPHSGLVDSYHIRNYFFWASSLRGRIKPGQSADLCSWLAYFSQCKADWFCLLMPDISRLEKVTHLVKSYMCLDPEKMWCVLCWFVVLFFFFKTLVNSNKNVG